MQEVQAAMVDHTSHSLPNRTHSPKLILDTISAARTSMSAVGSQMVQLAWPAVWHQSTGEPESTHRPEGVCTIWPVAALKARVWAGSLVLHTAVVTTVPTAGADGSRV